MMGRLVNSAVLVAVLLLMAGAVGWSAEGCGGKQSPYAGWRNGPPSDPSFFPIAVWCQDSAKAEAYKAIGINTYVALWNGPTEEDLAKLKQAGMRLVSDQNAVALKHLDDPTIIAWMHGDEPDNYQEKPGSKDEYVPAIPPSTIIDEYNLYRRNDPTRPAMLNLGQGVSNDENKGTSAVLSGYPEYMKGADIVSFDIYPMAYPLGATEATAADYLWMVAKGVDRLARWGKGEKVVWNALECTHIRSAENGASPEQVKSEVWMSIIHGSMGIIYFVHQFEPTFDEAALLASPEMSAAVKAVNQQITALAPVLNSPTIPDGGTATSSNPLVPIDVMAKQCGNDVYLFAVGMRNLPSHAELTMDVLHRAEQNGAVEVVGENRTLPMWGGRFEDDFKPYEVHIYKATLGAK